MSSVETNSRPVISIYGSSMTEPHSADYRGALELGRLVAERGADVACGGYHGVMEAAARGSREGGGRAIGYTVEGWAFRSPNEWIDDERTQSNLYERLRGLIENSAALIALGGGIGTLAEVALAWNLLYLDLIPQRPLIVVGENWSRAVESMIEQLEITEKHSACLDVCADNNACIELLCSKGILS